MKRELIFLAVIVASALIFFSLRASFNKNKTTNGKGASVYPTIEEKENFAKEIPLTITEPANNAVVASPNIVVAGKTSPNADVIVNDIEIQADGQGNFRTSLLLDLGNNIINVLANDPNGNYSETEIVVVLKETSQTPPSQ